MHLNDCFLLERPQTPYHSPRHVLTAPASTRKLLFLITKQAISFHAERSSDQDTTRFVHSDPSNSVASNATRPSTCSHSVSSQGLCYPCHQRALRNIPISLDEERKEREQLQDKLLQMYQQRKDALAIATETV